MFYRDVFVLCFLSVAFVAGTHFGGGSITTSINPQNPRQVTFQMQNIMRRSYFAPLPNVGDLVALLGSYTNNFYFGDGTSALVSSLISSVDVSRDRIQGTMTVTHTYASYGTYTAYYENCCRRADLQNNPNAGYRIETKLVLSPSIVNSPIVTNVPSMILPQQSLVSFQLEAIDGNSPALPLTYSLANSLQMGQNIGGIVEVQPPTLGISSSGLVTVNTAALVNGGYYSAGFIVSNGVDYTMIDLLFQISNTVSRCGTGCSQQPAACTVPSDCGFCPNPNGTCIHLQFDWGVPSAYSLQYPLPAAGSCLPTGTVTLPAYLSNSDLVSGGTAAVIQSGFITTFSTLPPGSSVNTLWGTSLTGPLSPKLIETTINVGNAQHALVCVQLTSTYDSSFTSQYCVTLGCYPSTTGVVTTGELPCCSRVSTPPSISGAPSDTTLYCGQALPPAPTVTGTNYCPDGSTAQVLTPTVLTSGSCPYGGQTVTRIWSSTDTCGRTTSATQTITFLPISVSITLNANVTVGCHADGGSDIASINDNCPFAQQIPTYQQIFTPGTCVDDHTSTKEYTYTDLCGATATATRIVTSQDTTAPTLTVPSDVTFECGSGFSTDVSSTGLATATDDCDPSPAVDYTDESTASSCFSGTGLITRTFTATDRCGNQATGAPQHINIVDHTAPSIQVPPDQTFECATSFSTDITATGNAIATDSCDPNPSVSHTDQTTPSSCFSGTGLITRTFTAADSCGNSVTGSPQHLYIVDTTPPSITTTNQCLFPPNGIRHCYSRSDLLSGYSDTCDSVTVPTGTSPQSGWYYDAIHDEYCVDAVRGLNIGVSFTATDSCGNQASSTSHITAPDTNSNCAVFTSCDATITGVSSSEAVFTTIDAYGYDYAPQYRAAVTITVEEATLSNWRLEIHFPDGEQLVRYSQYDVYTDGQFKCETSTRSTAVVSPQPWAVSVAQGGIITVEYVATNHARLLATDIPEATHLYVFTAN